MRGPRCAPAAARVRVGGGGAVFYTANVLMWVMALLAALQARAKAERDDGASGGLKVILFALVVAIFGAGFAYYRAAEHM